MVPLMTLVSGPGESRARADAELEEALPCCRVPRLEQVTLVAVGPQVSLVTVPSPRIHAHTCTRMVHMHARSFARPPGRWRGGVPSPQLRLRGVAGDAVVQAS